MDELRAPKRRRCDNNEVRDDEGMCQNDGEAPEPLVPDGKNRKNIQEKTDQSNRPRDSAALQHETTVNMEQTPSRMISVRRSSLRSKGDAGAGATASDAGAVGGRVSATGSALDAIQGHVAESPPLEPIICTSQPKAATQSPIALGLRRIIAMGSELKELGAQLTTTLCGALSAGMAEGTGRSVLRPAEPQQLNHFRSAAFHGVAPELKPEPMGHFIEQRDGHAKQGWCMLHSPATFASAKEFPIRAACVFLTDAAYSSLLLVHSKKNAAWELPGGHVEACETPLAAAYRELREETGIRTGAVTTVGCCLVPEQQMAVYVCLPTVPLQLAPRSETDGAWHFPLSPSAATGLPRL